MEKVYTVKTEEETKDFVKELFSFLKKEKIKTLLLSGDLGAGKTFISKEIAKLLGITQSVQSPTFTLLKRYETNDTVFQQFFHIDLYRIENEADIKILNLPKLYETKNALVCIEWPENIQGLFPEHFIQVSISHKGESVREFNIKKV